MQGCGERKWLGIQILDSELSKQAFSIQFNLQGNRPHEIIISFIQRKLLKLSFLHTPMLMCA